MTRRSGRTRYVILIALMLVGAWYWFTPRRAWDRFLQSIAMGDAETLDRVVDFAKVRANLKSDLSAALTERTGRNRIAVGLGGMMIDPMIDMLVQPEGLAELVNSFSVRGTDATQKTVVSYRYHSPSRVDVRIRSSVDPESAAGIFTFERSALSWRLVRVWSERLATSRETR